MIEAEQISKSYQDVDKEVSVFRELGFCIDAGQTIALMAQSEAVRLPPMLISPRFFHIKPNGVEL